MIEMAMKASEAASYISDRIAAKPQIAIILGSGLGGLADEVMDDKVEIPYQEIPNFPISTVSGHEGKIIAGKIYDKNVIIMKGRFHYYEGYDLSEVTFPLRVFALMGVSELIVSNAAGAINKKLEPTDLMLITDHINFAGLSPLRGKNEELFGVRFPSMTNAYSKRLGKIAKEEGNIKEGVYAYMTGPQYETPAEIKMLGLLGADAVGMSTVPEVIVANQMGIEVLGISCITNETGGTVVPTHEEVMENADKVEEKFKKLILKIIRRM